MNQSTNKKQFLLLLIPVVIYTLAEEYWGLTWGLILTVIFTLIEMGWEIFKYKKISRLTLSMNLLIIFLSAIALFMQDGIWFKLQTGIMELIFAGLLIGSSIVEKPLLLEMIKVQNPAALENLVMVDFFKGLNLRLGLFFIAQAALATFAALCWPTGYWALLKSIGIIVMMGAYLLVEIFLFRLRQKRI